MLDLPNITTIETAIRKLPSGRILGPDGTTTERLRASLDTVVDQCVQKEMLITNVYIRKEGYCKMTTIHA